MDQDHQDLLRGLFAAATVAIEAANEVAVEGQAPLQDATAYGTLAQQLHAAIDSIAALAEAAQVIADQASSADLGHPDPPC